MTLDKKLLTELDALPNDHLVREQRVIKHLESLMRVSDGLIGHLTYNPDLNNLAAEPVRFINPGHLDPRAFQVFGLSVKSGSTTPIGQFGTGLKYAIAVCLRHGCSIEIALHSAPGQPSDSVRKFSFAARKSQFRGEATTEIVCHEEGQGEFLLPFTIDLGKHWQLWQAFRELESNVRDEGGFSGVGLDCNSVKPHTIITIRGPEFAQVYTNRDLYFLPPNYYAEASRAPEGFFQPRKTKNLFYKGVRVYESDDDFLFLYDIQTPLPLTEDRTVSSIWALRSNLRNFWLTSTDEAAIFKVITAPKDTEECHIEFDCGLVSPGIAFKNAVHRAIKERPIALNASARRAVQADTLDSRFVKPFELDTLQQARLDRCISHLKRLGYPVDTYPIRLVDIDSELAGMAKDDTIILTRLAFANSTQYLASTILEEFFHLKHGYADHTCAFQDFLHDEIVRMGERVLGEPL